MNYESILQNFPHGEMRNLLATSIVERPEDLWDLWRFARSKDRYAWRGCWIIDRINDIKPEMIAPLVPEMVNLIPNLKHEGQKRILFRIICGHRFGGILSGELLNSCLKWLQDSSVSVGVRCGAMDAVVIFTHFYPDIKQEVTLILKNQFGDLTPGIRCRIRKTLQLLERIE